MPKPSLLIFGESYHNSNLFYKTRFLTSHPLVYLEHAGESILVTSTADLDQAEKESRVSKIYSYSYFHYVKHIKKLGHKDLAFLFMLKEILNHYKITQFTVPKDFPVFFANGLIKSGFQIHIDCDFLVKERSIKSPEEIQMIQETQYALEKGMAKAERIIREAHIGKDGLLYHNDNGLTTKDLKKAIELTLLKEGCHLFDIIVACGKNGSDPHYFGESALWANKPIMIDIFPFHSKHRYFADTTRSFIKKGRDDKAYRMHESVLKAQKRVISEIKAGVTGSQLYQTACDSFNSDGFLTLREQKPTEPMLEKGFIHSLGHGLGLDVHEPPFLFSQPIELKAGNIITIEPGLYDPEGGGVRIEDLVLVTEDSCKLITQYHKEFNIN